VKTRPCHGRGRAVPLRTATPLLKLGFAMTLDQIIKRLIEIRDKYDCGGTNTVVMEEWLGDDEIVTQYESGVTDIAASVGNYNKCS